MALEQELGSGAFAPVARSRDLTWLFSWPLLAALATYLYSLVKGSELLLDGDTYWHVATGQWILRNGVIPTADPFSHSMPGTAWTAHEWLSDLVLAAAHEAGGWALVVAVTGAAFAFTVALLMRSLLRWFEPIYAILFTGLAVAMTTGHLLARPHILAMPLMMVWTIELVRATEARRLPAWWMLPLMTVWANLHGGFTLGIALACAAALEAAVNAGPARRMHTVKAWGIFVALTVAFALLTPHGVHGITYTWHVLFDLGFVLERIGEWHSPDFHTFNALELWILAGLALVMYQGLRLPPVRLAVVVGLLHLSLKHGRYVELLGMLGPLFFAAPLAAQWELRKAGRPQLDGVDRIFRLLAEPASKAAVLAGMLVMLLATVWGAKGRVVEPPESISPARAVQAVQKAGIRGNVLNSYSSGGYLIYRGIPVFIDGRSDMYGETHFKQYVEALELRSSDGLETLLDRYRIGWTLLEPTTAAVALLDHLPGWRRVYADETAVVHARVQPDLHEVPPRR